MSDCFVLFERLKDDSGDVDAGTDLGEWARVPFVPAVGDVVELDSKNWRVITRVWRRHTNGQMSATVYVRMVKKP